MLILVYKPSVDCHSFSIYTSTYSDTKINITVSFLDEYSLIRKGISFVNLD